MLVVPLVTMLLRRNLLLASLMKYDSSMSPIFSALTSIGELHMEQCLTPSEIKKLSIAERILIVQEIWDSIASEQELIQLTAAQRTELDKRLASYEASPNEGKSWEEIKRRLKTSK